MHVDLLESFEAASPVNKIDQGGWEDSKDWQLIIPGEIPIVKIHKDQEVLGRKW